MQKRKEKLNFPWFYTDAEHKHGKKRESEVLVEEETDKKA
jgi:hypothetical protein